MKEAYHIMVSPMEEEKSYHTHLISFLRTSNIFEGKIVIFPISHGLIGIFNFVLMQREKEVHNTP